MIGKILGHYQILEKLGEGGMSVVYKARDTRLDRFAAIKVLPHEKLSDSERKLRFMQEAKAASALNHPNIIHIYDIDQAEGIDFIAMEYVDGRTLDEVIGRKGLNLSEALKCAVQVADALATAHEAGIVHRDLKPGNVMVTGKGQVKVLDFGLAKLTETITPGEADVTRTLKPVTEEGKIVGTVAYMSPEQAEGKKLDARSDIFSFGSLLYEMVTGKRAFQGESNASTLAAILKDNPEPASQLVEDLPREVERLISRCLRKEVDKRFQHMDDVKIALEELKEDSDSGKLAAAPARAVSRPRRLWWRPAIAAVVLVALAAAGWLAWRFLAANKHPEAIREVPFTTEPGYEYFPSFSPDGSTIAFTKAPPNENFAPGEESVQVKMLGAESTQLLQKPAMFSVWSPDGNWIAFGRVSWPIFGDRISICVMPRIGGAERKIAEVNMNEHPDRFVSWSPDGKWLVSMDREDGNATFHLVLISVETGEKHKLTSPPDDIFGDSGPALSPNGRTLAFTRNIVWGASDLWLLPLGANLQPSGEPQKLTSNVPNANCPAWTPDGKEIIFCSRVWHRATLWRIRADGSRPAQPLPFAGRGAYFPDIAHTGNRMAYTKHYWDTNIWRVELQPSGQPARPPEKFIQSTLNDSSAAWSPDGQWIAFASERSGNLQIWLGDAAGGSLRQITAMESTWGMEPKWSPDSQWIAFQADTEGVRKIYVVNFHGSTPRQLTFGQADDTDPHWSPDGNWIYFRSNRDGAYKVWRVSLQGGEPALADEKILGQEAPGGAGVHFVQEDSAGLSLWQQPPNGGQAIKILDGLAGPDIAVTRQGIYYTAPVAGKFSNVFLAFHSFATKKSIRVADLRPGTSSGTDLSVSPDGRYLLYTQCDEETDDLMLVENFR